MPYPLYYKFQSLFFYKNYIMGYHNLDLIHNGSEAMASYANMGNLSKEDMEYTRERLLQ